MAVAVKIPRALCEQMRLDVVRPHPFALERVGFAFGRPAASASLVLLYEYESVPDDDYVNDGMAGATFGAAAIRRVRQRILDRGDSAFHVHMHEHRGRPWFSRLDRSSLAQVVGSFRSMARKVPHGAILLSDDSIAALTWPEGATPEAARVSVIGYPLQVFQ
jgi:hypothetical protein